MCNETIFGTLRVKPDRNSLGQNIGAILLHIRYYETLYSSMNKNFIKDV